MTTPTTVPTTIARQRALVRAFRNTTQQWADTQHQEGQRYRDNAQEYARHLEQSNQAAQNQRSLAMQSHEQVVQALNPVELAQKLQGQQSSFTPTIEDSTKQPASELSASVGTLEKLTEVIQRQAGVRRGMEAERLTKRRRNTNLIIFCTGVLILIFLASSLNQTEYPNVLALIILLDLIIPTIPACYLFGMYVVKHG